MDSHKILYILLMTFELLTCAYSQGAGDVWFSLRNTTYQNNSNVVLEDIGEGDDALLCVTNRSETNSSIAFGEWFFPNETRVPSEVANETSGEEWDFYRTRGQMVVRMNRRRGGEDGIYCCVIPNAMNVTQTIYIGVYSISTSAGDVWFSLRGTTYQNNSIVTLEDIGEGDDALLCRTNLIACCRSSEGAMGNWFFPNETRVPSSGSNRDFYRTRGQMVVLMQRRRGGVEGIYHCMIPNIFGLIQTLYIKVYSASTVAIFRNTTYQNNSVVILEDIGKGDDDSLFCITFQTACCRPPYSESAIGNWFFPNESRVPSSGSQWDITRTRGQMVVVLHRRRGGEEGIYRCEIPVAMNEIQTIYIGVYSASTVSQPLPTTTILRETMQPTSAATTLLRETIQPTPEATGNLQPTTIPQNNRATTLLVIIVVTVVIILLIIIVGVVILVVLCRVKKKKQHYNVPMENIELKEGTTEDLTTDQPLYAVVDKETAPSVPKKSDELVQYLKRNSTFTGEVPTKLIPADSEYALPASPSRLASISHPMFGKMESNPMYQSVDQSCESPSYTNVPEGTAVDDIYTMPDIANPHTVEPDSEISDAVYSEPLQPSLFRDTVGSPSESDDLQPYGPIYSATTALPKKEEMPLNVLGDNIREIRQLGIGLFGKVILAETVGLSPKDLKTSKTDDDKSKSTLVAVKTLKSGAPSTTKEAFEKEVNFMSRLNDRNVIRILGVCYEDTPFIMMEYMEKGDLNRYLRKFKILSTTDSESQGQITTSTLIHITTQIASAMKYLASHNYVHRDLATRNCLVGPNYLVKISDFGMSRSLYESHYYCIQGHAILPVRWMSVECFYGKFSQKSDVWAFGVTIWEIFTLAKEQPYKDMSDKQVVDDAIKGKDRKLLPKPDMCPPEVYDIILKCWAHNTKARASFDELFQLLSSICGDQI